ncbi:MAG: glucose-1-phosphate adenylyltransferase subunit GlgD [Oscillospiraceae bacterium]|nr:glucose-1-phosphate adenylyltransferase subunit GlgD [Oscillospiraceae bacterium]
MSTMGIIFANIYDSSLGELTNKRTMASLPYGGRYRQIDFSLSNMTNSGIRHIGVITKYNYQSLMNHIGSGQEWDLELEEGGLEFLSPYATDHNASYRGKLEALSSAMSFLTYAKEEYVILVDSGVLCAIDFNELIENHIASGADVTVCVKKGIANGEKLLDMAVKVDKKNVITDLAVDYAADESYLASMGIFVMRRDRLIREVTEAVAHNRFRFERDMVLHGYTNGSLTINAYSFQGVALFNESTAEFFHNNLALLDRSVRDGIFRRPGRTIYTKVRNEIPSYYGESSEIDDCMVADGCVLEGTAIHSILFRGVKLGKNAVVKDSIIMSDAAIGEGAELEYVILDKDVVVGAGKKLCGTYEHPLILKRGEIV